ncbi:MAG: GxxExxY protein [Acidobacteria bacterium]|nr:GxxExxY protein [Acidobacteriota bacterium]
MHTVKTKGESNRAPLLEEELTEKILGAAFKVQNTLGCGFLEKVYENAMVVELSRAGISVEQQKPMQVRYQGAIVGEYQADLVVDSRVMVELKAVSKLDSIHEAQLLNYLKATRVRVGLLFNFGCPKLQYRRFVV